MNPVESKAPIDGSRGADISHPRRPIHPDVVREQPVDVLDDVFAWARENVQLRTWIGLLLFILACAMCLRAFSLGSDSATGGLLLNLGTELIGMLLTVVLVERLFEERKKRQDAKRLAMQFLHDLDDVVWVWQGGRRQFSSAELKDLLFEAKLDDPIAPCTADLLMKLGDSAARTRRYEPEAVKCSRLLSRGLRDLESFVQMRDRDYFLSAMEIGKKLRSAAYHLSLAADIRKYDSIFPPPPGSRNASIEEQERRNAGGYLNLRQ